MNTRELIDQVRKRAEEFDEVRIYYTLKKMGVRPVHGKTIELVRTLLAFNSIGCTYKGYVTLHMLKTALGVDLPTVRNRCHILGDKSVLDLKYLASKYGGIIAAYKISKEFLDAYKRGKKTE